MSAILKVTILALCLALTAAKIHPMDLELRLNLMDALLKSSDFTQVDAGLQKQCMDAESAAHQKALDNYGDESKQCENDETKSKTELEQSKAAERDEVTAQAQAACQSLSSCSGNDLSIPFFGCIVNNSPTAAWSVVENSGNANLYLIDTQQQYDEINSTKTKCDNVATYKFIAAVHENQLILSDCLKGKTTTAAPPTTTSEPPEETTTTTQSTETESTTEEPPEETTTTTQSTETESTTEEPPEETTTTTESAETEPTTEGPPEETTTTAQTQTTTEESSESTEPTTTEDDANRMPEEDLRQSITRLQKLKQRWLRL